jgi:hypothetical protein
MLTKYWSRLYFSMISKLNSPIANNNKLAAVKLEPDAMGAAAH